MGSFIDFDKYYWDRITGYASELRVDARWLLRGYNDDKTYGSLRIVSHPDLHAGYLRAVFTYIKEIKEKSDIEYMKTLEKYHISAEELEIYSVDRDFDTEIITHEAPFKELEEMFNVEIFK